ncbi:hypothetical protein [Rhizobium giardinii]|uniref:Uncharacterized protein n=1 Tax=Rhizobium giardinii TaxID=56731 RepID=A0A7W8UG70_9HYPH|nr:hypothetical protein [Rhizobium giardinii]MBB5538796.1 hypothetical protein [Rhizobium giardinii]
MRLRRAANSDQSEFGISVVQDEGAVSLSFDLEVIAAFRTKFGDGAFVEVATRYVEERAEALSVQDELWLWKEAVAAQVMLQDPLASIDRDDW